MSEISFVCLNAVGIIHLKLALKHFCNEFIHFKLMFIHKDAEVKTQMDPLCLNVTNYISDQVLYEER